MAKLGLVYKTHPKVSDHASPVVRLHLTEAGKRAAMAIREGRETSELARGNSGGVRMTPGEKPVTRVGCNAGRQPLASTAPESLFPAGSVHDGRRL